MATREEIYQAILNADKAGDSESVQTLGAYLQTMDAPSPPAVAPAASNPSYASGAALRPSQRDTLATLQGPTFGFGDEILGGVVGGLKTPFNDKPLKQNYQETRDFVRGAVDTQQKFAPVQTATNQLIASLPVGGPLIKVAGKLFGTQGLVANSLAGLGVGATSGLINALGTTTADTAGQAMDDAALPTAIAAGLGAAMPTGFRGVGMASSALASKFNDSAALRYAKEKLAEAFNRDAAPGVVDPIRQAATRLERLGPEARLADAGSGSGASVRGTLDTMATLPGRTKNATEQAIRERTAGRGARMIDAAEEASGTGGLRMSTEMGDWMAQRSQAAAPLYEKVHKIDIPASGDLAQIVDIANRNGFNGLARRIADYDRVPFSLPESAVNQSGQFSVRDLDYLKRAMDTQIAKLVDPATKAATAEGRALMSLRDDLVSRMDRATFGQYKVARDAWSGPSQMMDAANAGRMALTKDDATIKTLQAGLSASEKDAFALGAFESLRAKLGSQGGQTEILNLWKQPGLQEKLKAIFGNERAYREFATSAAREARLKALEGVGRGSQTASRQYAAGDLDIEAARNFGGALTDASNGNVPGFLSRMGNAWNQVKTPEPVRDAMGRMLLSRGQEAQDGLLSIQDIARQMRESRMRQAVTGGLAAPNLLLPMINP